MNEPNCLVCSDTGKSIRRRVGTTGVVLGDCPACKKGEIQVSTQNDGGVVRTPNGPLQERRVEQALANVRLGPADPPPFPGVKKQPSIAANVASEVGAAFANAAKARAAREVNAQLVTMVKKALGDRIPQNNAMLDAALGIAVPVILLYGTQALSESGQGGVPAQLLAGVQKTSTYAMQGVTQNMVDQVVDQALPLLQQVAALGAGLMMGAGELEAGHREFLRAGEDVAHEATEEDL